MNCVRFLFVLLSLRSTSILDIKNGTLFRPQRIIHTFSATSLPSAKLARIQALHILLWKDILMKFSLLRLAFISLLAAEAAPNAAWPQVQAAPPLSGVKGKLESFTGSSLVILTKSGVVHVNIQQPLTTYKQIRSDLSHVTSTSFVGVASIKQADGAEVATQIKIFPPEPRGAGEGSSMMQAVPGAMTHSRMTNGSVSRPAMSHLSMTNGTVRKGKSASKHNAAGLLPMSLTIRTDNEP
jgi:hypothetical protein